jgi:hypothetical protein
MEKPQKKVKGKKGKNKLIWIIIIGALVIMLGLGIYLILSQTSCCNGVKTGELTDQQLRSEMSKLFSGDIKSVVYPSTRLVEITQGDSNSIGLGIKNLLVGTTANKAFSYTITLSKVSGCSVGISKETTESWITSGRTGEEIPIPPGDFSAKKVLITIPDDAPPCIIKYGIFVMADETSYTNNFFEVRIKEK